MTILTYLLMSTPQGGEQGSGLMTFLPLILIAVVFYFFMIRPQTKKMKDQKKFTEEVKKGDKVVTIAGIHGRILEIADDYFMLEIDANVKIKIERSAVSMDATSAMRSKENR